MREVIESPSAPKAVGPYSQGIKQGEWLFLSGQIPLDPVTGDMVHGDAALQTEQVLSNMAALLDAAGAGFDDVVKSTMFLVDLSDFAQVNEVYRRYFREPFPARSTIQVVALPRGARIEIEVIALVGGRDR